MAVQHGYFHRQYELLDNAEFFVTDFFFFLTNFCVTMREQREL